MQPPIKRATRNADNIFKDRGTSNAIPLWENLKGTRKIEHKRNIRLLKAAKSEIDLLNLLKQFPGQGCKFYAHRLPGRKAEWVRVTLQEYAKDGLVSYSRPDVSYLWYLND